MKAIILVGGQGTRLRPLTNHLPKNIVPLCGAPFLHYPIEQLKKANIREIVFSVGYKPEAIRRVYRDGRKLGVKIHYALETKPLGTGGAIKNAQRFVKGHPVVVFNGDILTDLPLSRMIAFHYQKKSKATLGLVRVEDPTAYGLVLLNAQSGITRFLEKPSARQAVTDTINAGVYVFEPSVFDLIPPKVNYSAERGLFPTLLSSGASFHGFVWDGYWQDIGTPWKYLTTHWDILGGAFALPSEFKKRKNVYWGKGVRVGKKVTIQGPALIGAGSILEEGAQILPYTVLGARCRVGAGAVVSKSVLWDGARLGPAVVLEEVILGRDTHVQAYSKVAKGSVLADHSRV